MQNVRFGKLGEDGRRFDPVFVFLFDNGLTEMLSFNYTLGVERTTVASVLGRRETNNELVYTGALSIAAARNVGVFVELYGARDVDREEDWKVSFDTGVTWLVGPRVQLDLSLGHGVSDPAADRFVAFGLTARFPR